MTSTPYTVDDAVASAVFRRVFGRAEAYEAPFTPNVPYRAIVYPFVPPAGDPLPDYVREALEAVAALARAAGDDGFYRTYFDVWTEDKPRSSFVPLSAVPDEYRRLDQCLEEVALVSTQGRWGLMADEDRWALVGTDSAELLDVFLDTFPTTPATPRVGLRIVSEAHDVTWQPAAGVPARQQVRVFLSLYARFWRGDESTVTWLRRMLQHVYGDVRADELLLDWPVIR